MSERRFRFWTMWLIGAFGLASLLGVVLVFASGTGLFDWWNGAAAEAFWGATRVPAVVDEYRAWITAVLGATLAAWAVLGALVTRHAFARGQRWARDAIVASLVVWAPLDTLMSIRAGVWANVWFNVAALLLLTPPLIATRRAFATERGADGAGAPGPRS